MLSGKRDKPDEEWHDHQLEQDVSLIIFYSLSAQTLRLQGFP